MVVWRPVVLLRCFAVKKINLVSKNILDFLFVIHNIKSLSPHTSMFNEAMYRVINNYV